MVHVLTPEDLQAAIAPLLKRITILEAGLSEWVGTKEAMRVSGLSRTALFDAKAAGKLRVKKEGRTVHYHRNSLLAYAKRKELE